MNKYKLQTEIIEPNQIQQKERKMINNYTGEEFKSGLISQSQLSMKKKHKIFTNCLQNGQI